MFIIHPEIWHDILAKQYNIHSPIVVEAQFQESGRPSGGFYSKCEQSVIAEKYANSVQRGNK
jgi:hypothetical protein